MTRVVIGAGVLAVSLVALALMVWSLVLAGHGRHRAAHRPAELPSPAPAGVPSGDGPDTLALLLDADRADFADCPAEERRTPHFLHSDGSRTCCRCSTITAGELT